MRKVKWMRPLATLVFLLVWLPSASADDEVVAGAQGGSYSLHMDGGQATSVTNDDGSVIQYRYDPSGAESGLTVYVDGVALSLDYSTSEYGGFVYAAPLPPMMDTNDAYGRTTSVTLYPGMWYDNGEWTLDVNGPDPIPAATLAYGPSGHLSSITLNTGLSMELARLATASTPSDLVSQNVYAGDGTVLATGAPAGGTNSMRIAPTQLDAVATQLGLGANWAETLVFTRSANGQLTTARNATTNQVVLYMVDAGPYRVGYTPDGTPVFYDFSPSYGVSADPANDPATQLAGVAPQQIVMTATGATGMYTDRPADGAVYGAWTDSSGAAHYGRLTTDPEPESVRRIASDAAVRPGKISTNMWIRHRSEVCVNEYCWVNYWYEYVDDGIFGGGPSSGGGGTPANGGTSPGKNGNQVKDPILRAATERALNKVKDKLKNPNCSALLNRAGTNGMTLKNYMKARGYTDPYAYMTTFLKYETGSGSKDCPNSSTKASTTVYGQRVAICSGFKNSTDGWNAVYLIHEMMHTLGQGEAPTPGQPSSSDLNQIVSAACGN